MLMWNRKIINWPSKNTICPFFLPLFCPFFLRESAPFLPLFSSALPLKMVWQLWIRLTEEFSSPRWAWLFGSTSTLEVNRQAAGSGCFEVWTLCADLLTLWVSTHLPTSPSAPRLCMLLPRMEPVLLEYVWAEVESSCCPYGMGSGIGPVLRLGSLPCIRNNR